MSETTTILVGVLFVIMFVLLWIQHNQIIKVRANIIKLRDAAECMGQGNLHLVEGNIRLAFELKKMKETLLIILKRIDRERDN